MNVESTDETDLTRGYATALLSAAILSTTAIFIRYLTLNYDMPALVLAFWRAVFVALTLLPILAIRRRDLLRTTSKHREYLLLFGFILSIFNSLWTLSVAMNGAAISTVLAYSSAAFTALLGHWLLQERLGWGKILAVVLCITGCVLVAEAYDANAWQSNTLGILTGILSGLAYAVYSLMGRSASQRGLNPWTTLCYTFSFAAVFLLAYNLIPGIEVPGTINRFKDFFWLQDSLAGWGALLLLAAGPTLSGYGLYNVSLSYLPSSTVNLILTLEPAFTATLAYILFGERLNQIQIAGSFLIISGVAILRLFENRFANRRLRVM
ncbi:MAG: DMT family transporter [Anaerolineales bacterium]|jgi:drug/metabolite transporter (DMT)-like permease